MYFTWTDSNLEETILTPPTYTLSDFSIGNPQGDRKTTKGPRQHGTTLQDVIMDERTGISLTMVLETTTEQGIIDLCEEVRGIFNPLLGEGVLKWYRNDGTTRIVACTPDKGYPDFKGGGGGRNYGAVVYPLDGSAPEGIYWQLVTIRFTASDPFWYAEVPNISYIMGEGYATFPWYIPWVLGSGSTQKVLTNSGYDTPVTINIYGDITNPTLSRLATVGGVQVTETLTVVGQIEANERLEISTDDTNLYATWHHDTGLTENGIPYLNYTSKFWKLAHGNNTITLGKSAIVTGAYASLEWQDRFI